MTGGGRIAQAFARAAARKESALVTYVMAGDPDLKASKAMALACIEGGADMLELGMPFSDPIADGPTIAHAAERSLAAGTKLSDVLELAAQIRAKSDVPIVLMGYFNPVLSYGEAKFLDACAKAGVDAVLLPDLPPEEAMEFGALAMQKGVQLAFLLAPTSTPERRQAACAAATGFVYVVSVTGVTGARAELPKDVGEMLRSVREVSSVPVVVGFGVSSPDQAKTLAPLADGVVVGSAIVSRIAESGSMKSRAENVTKFVKSLKRGLKR